MKAVAPFVTQPVAVDCFVDPWLKPSDAILIGFNADIAAGAATRANRRRLLQIPDAHFETEISVSERAHRTDIDDISGKRIDEHGSGERGHGRMSTAIEHR